MVQSISDAGAIVRSFMRDAVAQAAAILASQPAEWDVRSEWERGSDGNFREQTRRIRSLSRVIFGGWPESQSEFAVVCDAIKNDGLIGPHVDKMVGTKFGGWRVESASLLRSLLYGMLNDTGELEFTDERFNLTWAEIRQGFEATAFLHTTVAPLPHLNVPFPTQLNAEIALDRLQPREVTQCCFVGLLRPISQSFPVILADSAVCVRRILSIPKAIGEMVPDDGTNEGSFGHRPPLRMDLVTTDVLSALRLFKNSQIKTTGYAGWIDAPMGVGGISYSVAAPPFPIGVTISEEEMPSFRELWQSLERWADRFEFAIHRFNLAFDRGLISDRIVDLMIAAESLFLRDAGDDKYRGELSYRCSLRVAKFIQHPTYGECEVFRLMRRAYDFRSTIVHGGSGRKTDTRLPDNAAAAPTVFVDVIEDLLRLAIRKALSMGEESNRVRDPQYWDTVLFDER